MSIFVLSQVYFKLLFTLIGLSLFSSFTLAQGTNIAVASNFTAPMKHLVKVFEQDTNYKIKLSFGSSGKFYAQIKHGAPFDIFFSADQTKPLALLKDNLAVKNSQFTYAIGALALWSNLPNIEQVNASTLQQNTYNKLAFANPKLAPYGTAALQVLNNLNLSNLTRSKWVQGENISQTYQFISTGNADLGFIALSQIKNQDLINKKAIWIVPNHLYQPIKQDATLLKRGEHKQAAKQFMVFMQSNKAKRIIHSFGYQTAD